MHDWMTNRHEGCVSTMLTDKRLKYCTGGAPLQGSGATKCIVQDDKHAYRGAFRLDTRGCASRHMGRSSLAVWKSALYLGVCHSDKGPTMAILSRKRQVTLPKELCDRLGVRPGDQVDFLEHHGRITILKRVRGASGGVLRHLRADRRCSNDESLQDALGRKRARGITRRGTAGDH